MRLEKVEWRSREIVSVGNLSRLLPLAVAVLAVSFSAVPTAKGASYTWQTVSGDWSIATNWSGSLVPTSTDHAWITNGDTATVTTMTPTCGTLSLGRQNGSGAVQMTGGSLTVKFDEYVGDSGLGEFTQSGGTNNVGGNVGINSLILGNGSAGNGTYNLSGNGRLIALSEYIGHNGIGTFNQSSGANNCNNTFALGGSAMYNFSGGSLNSISETVSSDVNGTATFNQTGGTNQMTNLYIQSNGPIPGSYSLSGDSLLSALTEDVGYSGYAAFVQSSGTNSISQFLAVAFDASDSGSYTLNAGLLRAPEEDLGNSGTGTITQSGGTNSVSNRLVIGYTENNGGFGVYNFSGGLLLVGSLTKGPGPAAFNFSGGVLQVTNSFTTSLPMTIASGSGATFDTGV